jgi:hypothetical protein
MKKKRKNLAPKRTTLPRPRRLLKAKDWIGTYTGKNIVRGYARHFRVDLLAAIKELRMLGVTVTTEYETAVKHTMADRTEQNRKKKEAKQNADTLKEFQDGEFAFIAGYTSGGLPYGVRWDDMPMDSTDIEE